ncbi:hypothetical protein CEXT_58571 [Caerostris extrusa]|uniref:Uncharacterized protein n=1 Tax=Caerostris extrusa TaxID=172846 RepID=A0AAV4U087_CAEEX|nr:hypothetical protein CEXT_58571 [Caerostris extrusa]
MILGKKKRKVIEEADDIKFLVQKNSLTPTTSRPRVISPAEHLIFVHRTNPVLKRGWDRYWGRQCILGTFSKVPAHRSINNVSRTQKLLFVSVGTVVKFIFLTINPLHYPHH